MKSRLVLLSFLSVLALSVAANLVLADGHDDWNRRGHDDDDDKSLQNDDRVQRGFEIAPVKLNLDDKKRNLVGLGSYLVNAGGACADCHTCPTYAPGHNPYQGQPKQINATNYLAGGVHFGPFTSANLTPDFQGRPAGLTLEKFIHTLRTGQDPDNSAQILQVMPWPIYGNMTDRDLKAIYEYLSAIPHAQPGACGGAGE
jgi:hypothetical protein